MKFLKCLMALVAILSMVDGAAADPRPPQFREVFEIVRTNLGGMNPEAVERAALKALLKQLDGQVVIEDQPTTSAAATAGPPVSKSAVFDNGYGYVRISQVGPKLESALADEFGKLGGTGKLSGLVLDLRYVGGSDEKAAARAADRFLAAEQALLTVNGEVLRSTGKTNAIQLPTAILVNRHTSGAAEVLAALLRQNHVGLLIGGATTGGARQFREFTLSTGQRLRIATGETKLGDGQLMPATGLRPDIAVNVGAEEERAFYAEPYQSPARTNVVTSADRRHAESLGRLNEAELVRRMKEGQSLETALSGGAPSVSAPQVRDPALARALDLLKGLSVMRPARP
ncbi:MAG: S41 family peptidase [Limisphaerales bacterium]